MKEHFERREWLWLAALLAVAALLRLPGLEQVPPGFQFDETYNAWDALRVVEGARPIFLPANAGREPLYTYWQAPFVALLGPTPKALRLASALPGIATVLLLYCFVRLLFPREGSRLAGLAALCLALSYWHLHFSRYAIRSILIPFWELPTFAALWLGLRRKEAKWFVLCGVGLAAMVWTHPVGRLMPLIVIPVVAYMSWADRQHTGQYLQGLLLAGLVALLLFLPLGHYFWQHPDQFLGHPSDVSVFHPRVHRGNLPRALALNFLRVAGMFTCVGDREWLHNLPGRPAFDPLLGIAFLAGLVILVHRLLRREAQPLERASSLLLGIWLILLLIPSAFSDMAPNFSRTIGVAPVAMLLAAWGLKEGWRWLEERGHLHLAVGLVAAILSVSGGWTAWDYFVRFARHPMAYYHYDQDKIDVAAFLHREATDNTLFLAPLWAKHPTVSLLTRDIDLRSVETNAALIFPAREGDRGILYAFPPEQEQNVVSLEREWGTWGQRDVLHDPQGHVLLHLFRIPAEHRPEPGKGAAFISQPDFPQGPMRAMEVQFGPSIRLLGYQVAPGLNTERELEVTLVWEALGSMDRDYTAFVHLLDEHGRRWGQADNWPGRGSYPTTKWHSGDVIIDRYRLRVDPCLPAGRYRLQAGWYDLATGERLRTPSGGLAARLGTVELDRARGVAAHELSPSHRVDYWLTARIRLFGFDLPEAELEVDRPFPLTLYWEAWTRVEEPATALIKLRGADGGEWELASFEVGREADQPWPPGEALCQPLRLRVGPVPKGTYRLRLAAAEGGQAIDLAQVRVMLSTRRYTAPSMAFEVNQDLGDAIRLLGCDLPGMALAPDGSVTVAPGEAIHLTLYWQMLRPVDTSYTVFTHLLDGAGQLRGQKDNIPVQGAYPTTEWVEGEVVEDSYELAVAPDAPPGLYQIEVGMYNAATGQRLPLTSEGREMGEDRILLPIQVLVQR